MMSAFLESVREHAPEIEPDCRAIIERIYWIRSDIPESGGRVYVFSTCQVSSQEVTVVFPYDAEAEAEFRPCDLDQTRTFPEALQIVFAENQVLYEAWGGLASTYSSPLDDNVVVWRMPADYLQKFAVESSRIFLDSLVYEIGGENISLSPQQALVLEYLHGRVCEGDYRLVEGCAYFRDVSVSLQNTCDSLFGRLACYGIGSAAPQPNPSYNGANSEWVWTTEDGLNALKAVRPVLPKEFPVHQPLRETYHMPR